MPVPPIKEMSSAPPRGNCSAVTPSMVGQRYVFPTPKTVAAANAMNGLVPGSRPPSQYRPMPVSAEQTSSARIGSWWAQPLK